MPTRVERNRIYRKHKRKLRLFILLVVALLLVSFYQINSSYEDLVGSTRATKIFALERSEDSMSIILLGERLQVSKSTLDKAMTALEKTSDKIFNQIQAFIQQVSN